MRDSRVALVLPRNRSQTLGESKEFLRFLAIFLSKFRGGEPHGKTIQTYKP